MKRGTTETAVGIFVLIGIICVGYLAVKLGRMEWFGQKTYILDAYFTSVAGLKNGASVEMAGVTVGRVSGISLDTKSDMARVSLQIDDNLKLRDDVIAAIRTSGLIGDKFIMLTPGTSEQYLKPGGVIMDTQSAVDIEELISKYVFGKVQ